MKQHHKSAVAEASGPDGHDHDGHDHAAHGHAGHHHPSHDHGHGGHHHHDHGPALAVAEPVGWSLLRASLGERLLVAAAFTALAWMLIGFALA